MFLLHCMYHVCYISEDYHCTSVSHLFSSSVLEHLIVQVASSQCRPHTHQTTHIRSHLNNKYKIISPAEFKIYSPVQQFEPAQNQLVMPWFSSVWFRAP